MPSLSETLQQNAGNATKPAGPSVAGQPYAWIGGQLVKSNQSGIQNLAQAAGTPVPTSALSAALLGATPQQQAMAGTQAQVQAANQTNIQKPTQVISTNQQSTLQNTQATKQQSSTQTAPQQQTTQQAQQLQPLVGVEGRVQNYINSKIAAMASTQVAGPAVANQASPADLQTALTSLQANPTDANTLAQVNTLLGRSPTSPLSADEVANLYKSTNDTILAGAHAAQPGEVTVGSLASDPNFGYSADQLSQILGLPVDQVSSMSLQGLQNAIQMLSTAHAGESQNQANSLQQGGAAQGAYLEQSKQLDVSGVSSVENQLNNIQQAVSSGQIVQFNGQQVSISTLLGDQGISKAISDYLNAPEGSQIRTQLDQTEPGLSQFIKSNVTSLTQLAQTMGQYVTHFDQVQADTGKLNQVGNTTLSDSVMKAIDTNWGQFNTSGEATSNPLLDQLKSLDSTTAGNAATALNEIASTNPSLLWSAGSLTADELRAIADPDVFSKWSANKKQLSDIQNTIQTNDINRALSLVVGQPTTAADVQKQLTQDAHNKLLGFKTSGLDQKIKMSADGSFGTAADILHNAGVDTGTRGVSSISDIASGNEQTYQGSLPQYAQLTPSQAHAAASLEPYIAASGIHITADQLLKSGITADDLQALQDSGFLSTLKSMAGKGVSSIQKAPLTKNTQPLLAQYAVPALPSDYQSISATDAQSGLSQTNSSMAALQQLISNPDIASSYDIPAIKNQISKLQTAGATYQAALDYQNSLPKQDSGINVKNPGAKNSTFATQVSSGIDKLANALPQYKGVAATTRAVNSSPVKSATSNISKVAKSGLKKLGI